MSVRFGDVRLDVDARRLFRGSREVHLSPKAFELLQLLVEIRPRALSKADILERVWAGVFVSESSLTKVVNQIRSALGDAAREPRFIRTVHGYGYAFVAEPADAESSRQSIDAPRHGACWFVCGRREFPLTDGEHIVGREPDAGIWLASPKVSRRHAKLTVSGMHATIEDLSSKNGTSVRGARISAPTALGPGDEVEIGPFTLVFRVGTPQIPTETDVASASATGRGRGRSGKRRPEPR